MNFPNIDPVAFSLGPLSVKWYGIAYVVSILLGWLYARKLVQTPQIWRAETPALTTQDLDDFIFWAAIGIVLGGRLGYIFFYDFPRFAADPLSALEVWNGGMSFHGGITGTTVAMILFARKRALNVWSLFDVIATVCVIGLFLVRIANFINGELWGKVTELPWGMVFPTGGPQPRHPSQLYEAALEGLLIGAVLAVLVFRFQGLKRPGLVTGAFIGLYALCRISIEFVREPDVQLGYLFGGWVTMGMLLSVPLLVLSLWVLWRSSRVAIHEHD